MKLKSISVLLFFLIIQLSFAQVTVSNREIRVDGELFQIRGVCYNPVPAGAGAGAVSFAEIDRDIELMQEACINTVRTYSPYFEQREFDKFHEASMKVIVGFWITDIENGTYESYINQYKNHPAVLMWAFGNEFNYNPGLFNGDINKWYTMLNNATGNAKNLDPNHPTATVHGELPSRETINRCPNVDIWGLNIYRRDNLGPLFTDFAARSGKPMFLAETGADSYPDPQAPAKANPLIYNQISNNGTWKNGAKVCSGVCWFSWTDEWWKSGNNSQQDAGGFSNIGAAYDGFANEEYWGLLDVFRNKKPGFEPTKNAFCADVWNPQTNTDYGVVTLFEDCPLSGKSVSLMEGEFTLIELQNKGMVDNSLSSIRILPGYEVELYKDDNFQGQKLTLNNNNDCLVDEGLNDSITSIKIKAKGISGLNGVYNFVNKSSQHFLDLEFDGTSNNGANYQQWSETGREGQLFILNEIENGVYTIINKKTNKSLDIENRSTENGANLQQYGTNTNEFHKQFIIVQTGENEYQIIPRHSGKVIEVEDNRDDPGANVHQFTNNGQENSKWEMLQLTIAGQNRVLSPITRIYPNPVEDHVIISSPIQISKVEILDLSGKIMLETNEQKIPTSTILSGIYFLKIYSKSKMEIVRIVKK